MKYPKIKKPVVPGWYWIHSKCGWSIVLCEQHGEEWMGLNPYTGLLWLLSDKMWNHTKAYYGPINIPTK